MPISLAARAMVDQEIGAGAVEKAEFQWGCEVQYRAVPFRQQLNAAAVKGCCPPDRNLSAPNK